MRPAARRSTAATSRPRRTPPTATGAGRRGRTRSSRTTPSSAWACAWRSTASRRRRGACSPVLRSRLGDALVSALLDADQSTEAGIAAQRETRGRAAREAGGDRRPGGRAARTCRRLPGAQERVDRRRRRLGVRHRLRRSRPRALDRPRRERPRARHRGVLQHRRPGSRRRRRSVRRRSSLSRARKPARRTSA